MKKLIVLLVVLMLAVSANAVLVPNPDDFQDGDYNGWYFWGSGSAAGVPYYGSPGAAGTVGIGHSAASNFYLNMTAASPPGAAAWGYLMALNSDNPANGNTLYTWGVDARLNAGTGGYLKMEYYAGLDKITLLGTAVSAISIPIGVWKPVSMSRMTPAGTNYITVIFEAEGPGTSFSIDNAYLVPEPTTIALLGLGGLFLRRQTS